MRFFPILRSFKLVLPAVPLALIAAPAAASDYIATVFASGLNNPRGLSFGPDGALYIAEGGFAEVMVPPGETYGLQSNGSISRVLGGSQSRIATGLPSIFNSVMGDVTGPQDIAFDTSGTGYVVMGLGANPAVRPAGSLLGHVLTFTAGGSIADFADVSAFEAMNNPVGGPVDSNPYHLAAGTGGLYATDAGANTLYSISSIGEVALVAGFAPRDIGPPPPVSDSVPTGVAIGPDGTIYVAELTGFPFTPGAARIYSIAPGSSTPTIFADGLTNLTDLAIGPDSSLYALSFDLDGILGPNVGGGIFRISDTGTFESVFSTGLINPTGLTIDGEGAFYVTTFSAGAEGQGQVLKIAAVPEPESWALMILGLGAVGMALRRSSSRRGEPLRA